MLINRTVTSSVNQSHDIKTRMMKIKKLQQKADEHKNPKHSESAKTSPWVSVSGASNKLGE